MNTDIHQERQQLCDINRFKQQFFNKYNRTLNVTIQQSLKIGKRATTDEVLNYLILVLNAMIPAKVKAASINNIFVKNRTRELADLRFIFMKVARDKGLTLPDIGRICGNLNHTTIIHGLRQADNLIHNDHKFQQKYETIIQILNSKFEDHAGIIESIEQAQNNSKPASVVALYSGKDTPGQPDTVVTGGSNDSPEIGLDKFRPPFRTKSFVATL